MCQKVVIDDECSVKSAIKICPMENKVESGFFNGCSEPIGNKSVAHHDIQCIVTRQKTKTSFKMLMLVYIFYHQRLTRVKSNQVA